MTNEQQKIKKLEGFGGWLLLFGFAIFLSTVNLILEVLSKPELLGLNFMTAVATVQLLINILLLYLMIKRKKTFKIWYITVNIVPALVALFTVFAMSTVDISNKEEMLYFSLETIFYTTIWSLYLWKSERVRNTFIN